jgi:hypothetical protein
MAAAYAVVTHNISSFRLPPAQFSGQRAQNAWRDETWPMINGERTA